MTSFTIDAVTKPVRSEDDWLPLRHVTDLIPGTILIEDPDEPMLILRVTSSSAGQAIFFIEGVLKLAGVELISGRFRVEDAADETPPVFSAEVERATCASESRFARLAHIRPLGRRHCRCRDRGRARAR